MGAINVQVLQVLGHLAQSQHSVGNLMLRTQPASRNASGYQASYSRD